MNQNNNSRQNESVINEREDEQLDQLVQAFNTLAVQNTNALQEVTKTTSMLIQAINNIQEQNKFQQQMMMSMMRQTTMLVEGIMHTRQVNEGNERIMNFQNQPVVQNPSNVQNPIGPLNFPSLRSTQESLLLSSQSNIFFESNVSRNPISAPPVPAFHSTPIVRSQGILSV
uniref:Uncharacterized protein n=1 Tax=Strongyloides papillosus TaxID=174720 RepID=A0A0N5BDQ3_STREA